MRQKPKSRPSSSQRPENIKSLSTTGVLAGAPLPRPKPNQPPLPIPKSD